MTAVIWFVVAGVLVGAELLTLTYVLGLLGVAAAIAGAVAVAVDSVTAQAAVAAVSAAVLLVFVRPVAHRHRQIPGTVTGTAALVGAEGVALSEVDAGSGQIKLAGEVWSARAMLHGHVIAAGSAVSVVSIDGATAVVHDLEV